MYAIRSYYVFDENYDVARDLEPEEFAPVVARLLGDTCLLISVPPENADVITSYSIHYTKLYESRDITDTVIMPRTRRRSKRQKDLVSHTQAAPTLMNQKRSERAIPSSTMQ